LTGWTSSQVIQSLASWEGLAAIGAPEPVQIILKFESR
jgi:hypothetical protein